MTVFTFFQRPRSTPVPGTKHSFAVPAVDVEAETFEEAHAKFEALHPNDPAFSWTKQVPPEENP
jgi:hypothetical protein